MQFDQQTLEQLRLWAEIGGLGWWIGINWCRQIGVLKEQAVKREDFALAKELKAQEDNLKKAGAQLLYLEEKKSIAIANEDYESAMLIKQEISKLRQHCPAPQSKLQQFNQENIEINNDSQFFQDQPTQ